MNLVKLEDYVEVLSGYAFSSINFNEEGSGMPIIRIRDVGQKESETYFDGEYDSKYLINTDDLLIAMDGEFRLAKWSGRPSLLNQRVCKIKSISNELLDEYLYYVLPAKLKKIEDATSYVTVKHLSVKKINAIEIPLPSLSEQKAIVAKLDRAQRLIDIDRGMLAKYDELIQSVFLVMFGDVENEKVSLSELVKLNPRKSEISDIDKSMDASFLGMADVGENGSLNLSELQTIEESWKGYTYFKEDDVLFAKITPCMENGKGAIAKGLRNSLGFGSTEFHVLRPIEGVSRSAWIYHLTHSDKFRKIAASFMKGSAGQKRVPTHFFDRFKVVKPSIEKQIRFEEIATEISEDKKRLRSQIKKSEELFSSLVQGAFST